MRIAILGTGAVGQTLGRKLVALGHQVTMGARTADNPKAQAFATETGARHGTFAEAARDAELVILATNGAATLDVARSIAPLDAVAVLDVTNPLDFSNGFPPTLIAGLSNTTSLGEQVQAALPGAHVVKALNTVNCNIMVDPNRLGEQGDIFVCGNNDAAKHRVIDLLKSFGWAAPVDLGPITSARATEQYLPFWVRLMGPMGGADFNIKLVK